MRQKSIFRLEGVRPIFAVFFAESLVLGHWIPRIPDIKQLYDLSASQLGLFLLVLSSGTFVSFLIGGSLAQKWGVKFCLMLSLPFWALFIGLVPFAGHIFILAIVLFLAGAAVGMTEIGINTAADKMEQKCRRRLMSKAHGFWSLGSLVGALWGTKLAELDVSVQMHFACVMPLIIIFSFVSAFYIPTFDMKGADAPQHKVKLPDRALILLCIMPLGIMIIEGAFIDWSALFMRDVLLAEPWQMGGVYVVFSAVMTFTRLYGDRILDRYGPYRVALISCLCATLGTGVFALAPNILWAFVGAVLSGAGVAIVYPLVMSAAARRPGREEDNVAALSLFAFMALMLAPPVIGFMTDVTGLRLALVLLVPLALLSVYLCKEIKGETENGWK